MFVPRAVLLLLFFSLFLECSREVSPPPGAPLSPAATSVNGSIKGVFDNNANINVLFVGNSLTYVNDLPTLVAEIAKMDGVTLGVTSITAGNYSLDDHWADGTIQRALGKNQYDLLIAQQGPSALPESQISLRESSIRIAGECRAHNTVFGLYMVWPALERDFDRDNCIASYTNAANASNALLCPAGRAWKLSWEKNKTISFYGPDAFHPSIHGSVLAAMTIYAAIKGKKDLDFIHKSDLSWGAEISNEHFEIMKSAAIESLNVP